MSISVVVPTYGRGQVLMDSIQGLLPQIRNGVELIIVDQTESHPRDVKGQLEALSKLESVCWIQLSTPSITHAMNVGLLTAQNSVVLFLDDDINADKRLVEAHLNAHHRYRPDIVAGRVVQPWEKKMAGLSTATDSSKFNSPNQCEMDEFMGGNFSVRRDSAIAVEGFDENFKFAAYHFEKDFANRITAYGGKILYWPEAVIDHLQASKGGVRSYGSYLTTFRPGHSVGAYYYIFKSKRNRIAECGKRLMRAIKTRFHLTHPWYIPVTLVAEVSGLIYAGCLRWRGPRLLDVKNGLK